MKEAEFSSFLHSVEQEILVPDARFYIWGAGVAGKALAEHLDGEPLNIVGFVDSNPEKQAKPFSGFSVIAPEAIVWTAHTKVILTSLDYPEGMEQFLLSMGKRENKDYFFSNTFLTVYMMIRHNRLHIHHLNVNITDHCTLRCRDCSLLVPYYSERKKYPLEDVAVGLGRFFGIVDYVQELHLIGGEPLLYKQLPRLIAEIGSQYRNKIGEFAIATNGTLVPDEAVLEQAKRYDVLFTISDYRGSAAFSGREQVDEILSKLERWDIAYRIGNKSVWFDFNGGIPEDVSTEDTLEKRFQKCFFRNRGLYLDRLYYCQHQYGCFRAGRGVDDPEGRFDLSEAAGDDKARLFRFELGALPRGYLLQCAGCGGFERLNTHFIAAAAQRTEEMK